MEIQTKLDDQKENNRILKCPECEVTEDKLFSNYRFTNNEWINLCHDCRFISWQYKICKAKGLPYN